MTLRNVLLNNVELTSAIGGLREAANLGHGAPFTLPHREEYRVLADKLKAALDAPPACPFPAFSRGDVLWLVRALEDARGVRKDNVHLARTYGDLRRRIEEVLNAYDDAPVAPVILDEVYDDEAILRWAADHGFEVRHTGGGCRALARTIAGGTYLVLTSLDGPELPPIRGSVSYTISESEEAWDQNLNPIEAGMFPSLTQAVSRIDTGVFGRKQAD